MAPISVTLAPRDPPAAIVALVGEHDAYSADRLESEFALLFEERRNVVVDLRDTEFIDSATLGALLAAEREAANANLGFVLVLPGRNYTQVSRLLELTGLASAFTIYDTLDDALSATRRGDHGGSVRSAA
jgi:anti-anti-sigma factor